MNKKTILNRTLPLIIALFVILIVALCVTLFSGDKDNPRVKNPEADLILKKEEQDLDQLNYLEGTNMDSVCKKAMQGTILAHVDGGVPNLVLEVEEMNAYNLGYLLYFFMFACGVSGYMLGVNPFNQPGVEDYKKNMFALLGKPGYEKLSEELKKRL